MNDSNENNALFQYAGCIVPLAAVTGALVILVAIAHLLGDIIIGSQLEKLPRLLSKTELANNTEFPYQLDLKDFSALTSAAFLWLFFVFVVWIAASAAILTSFAIVRVSFVNRRRRRLWICVLSGSLVALGTLFWFIDASFVSAQDIIQYLKLLAPSIRDLIETTTAFALLALFTILFSTSILLLPPNEKTDLVPKLKRLNILVYAGAAVLIAWIMQSRALYGFGAATLVEQHQAITEQVAPVISLVVGGLVSIVLGLMYLCSYLWLQSRCESPPQGGDVSDSDNDNPREFFRKHWTAVLVSAGPMLPGLVEMLTEF